MKRWLIVLLMAVTGCKASSKHSSATQPAIATTRPAAIDSFEGPYRFLSNFWPAEVEFEGHVYPTVEHAYQAAKFTDNTMRERVAAAPTPGEAKHIAHTATTQRANWDTAKFQVMEICVKYKFTHHDDLRAKLLDTGDAELIEGNTWGDQIWGVYRDQGDNRLGKLLMKIRGELRQSN